MAKFPKKLPGVVSAAQEDPAQGPAQLLECMSTMHKALDSTPTA